MDILEFLRSDIFYLAIDISVACLFVITIISGKNHLATFWLISLCLTVKLVAFVGFRPFDAGNDTSGYYYAFQYIDGISSARRIGGSIYGGSENPELLYWPFAALFKQLTGGGFREFLVISILIPAYLTYAGNKRLVGWDREISETRLKLLAAFFTYLVFISFEIAYFGGHIRSAIGVPLAFLSYYYATQRRFAPTAALFLLALGFHNSAISIIPLLAFEFLFPRFSISRKVSISIVTGCISALVLGKFVGVSGMVGLLGSYYSGRLEDYINYGGFNITSIFTTGYFWIILAHLAAFLALGYNRLHFYAFYYFGLVLLFSATPKISERYFAYILICLPVLLFFSLRNRLTEKKSLIALLLICYSIGFLVLTSYAVTKGLSINSYLPVQAE